MVVMRDGEIVEHGAVDADSSASHRTPTRPNSSTRHGGRRADGAPASAAVPGLPKTSVLGPRSERHALDGVDLEIEEYSSVGVVGESGSGKSTLVRILLGLDRPTAGEWLPWPLIEPGRPCELRWFRREAQIVLQDPLSSLDPRMTVASIIREPLVCLRIDEDHDRRVDEVLEQVGLSSSLRGATRTSSRAVSSNASRSPGRSPRALGCSSATSRSARSTSPCGSRSSTCSARSSATSGSPSC